MIPSFDRTGLGKSSVWEYALRFAFGGAVAVGAGLVARAYGPSIGGLFLAFPAILPASLTLVKQHDGREQAEQDARGACLGSAGLLVFAFVVLTFRRALPALALAAGFAAWALASVVLWFVAYGRRG